MQFSTRLLSRWLCYSVIGISLSACSGFLPSAGPSYDRISSTTDRSKVAANVVDVDEALLQEQLPYSSQGSTSSIPYAWRTAKPALTLGRGDGVQVSIFEAPPAVLLSNAIGNSNDATIGYGSGSMHMPEQMVSQRGTIVVPFAGEIPVAGKTTGQVESTIRSRLSKIANQPQVVVRLVQNQNNNVTVLGEGRSVMMPLTAKGERLLDTIPLVNNVRKIKNATVRLTRNGETHFVSVDNLSRDSDSNVYLRPGDIVSVFQDPYRVAMLVATNANTFLDFGDECLSVVEALGLVAGLNDFRADPRGIFIFRRTEWSSMPNTASNHYIKNNLPTIYRIDVSDVKGMLMAQNFKLQDKDMVYVSNASSIELQKVLGIFNASLQPVTNTMNSVNAFKN